MTKVGGELLMWTKWPNGMSKFVPSSEANKSWPSIVIKYYEDKIHRGDAEQNVSSSTRRGKFLNAMKIRKKINLKEYHIFL